MTIDLETPWVEKYRPQSFDDIVSQNIAVDNLKDFVESGEMPHMIFTGPAGTGKTSTALIVAKRLLPDENYYRNLLELNASDTVRMSYVRRVLKDFVNQSMFAGSKNSLKLVILDEADNIPNQVQQALRRIIEKSSSSVKFILMCNYINRIIDPIISRCAVFRFVHLPEDKIVERLRIITEKEEIQIPPEKSEEFFNTLYFISGGDLRKAINTLQAAVALELLENIKIDELFKISGFVEKDVLNNLSEAFQKKDFKKARNIFNSIGSFDSRNFIRQLVTLYPDLNLNKDNFTKLIAYTGEIDYKISQGGDDYIQILALIADIIEKIENLAS
ncbi:MAG: AAA family ATPase [Candidatus Lokiarchaeota archaeon]|nr:AAA family ATPase [Candidatus Lokiarchaeota archaeon]